MCEEEMLFSLIHAALCGEKLSEEIKKEMTTERKWTLFSLASRHDLAHFPAYVLQKEGMLGEDEISQKYRETLACAVYRDIEREEALIQMKEILSNAKIFHIPLKGAILCKYYPESWMRTSCDIDMLVKKSDVERAVERLCEAGFVHMKEVSEHDHNLYSPNGVHIELHFSLQQELLPRTKEILGNIWEESVLKQEDSVSCILTAEVFFLYHLAHMAKHVINGGCGIRPFLDLWLMEQNMSFDREKLYFLLESVGLLEFYKGASALGKVWMEQAKESEQTKLLADYILYGGTYGTWDNVSKIDAAQNIGKLEAFLRLAFLSRKQLEIRYPRLRKYPSLFLFYQVKRCFLIFKKEKRTIIKYKILSRNKISKEEVDHSQKMLAQLGLSGVKKGFRSK